VAAPDFTPRTQPMGATDLVAPMQQKVLLEYQAQEAKRERRRKAITDILSAVEQGQTIASNAMKLAVERRRQQGIAEMGQALSMGEREVTRSQPAAGPITQTGQAPVAIERTKLGQTPEGQEAQKQALLSAATKTAPDKAAASIIGNTFPKNASQRGMEQLHYLTLDDGSTVVSRFNTGGQGLLDINGNPLPPDVLSRVVNRTYAGDFRTDPVTGKIIFGNKSTGQLKEIEAPGKVDGAEFPTIANLTKEQDARFSTIEAGYRADKIVNAARETMSQLSVLQDVLNTDVGAATEIVKNMVARTIAMEKGTMTDQDVARAAGNQAFIPKITRLLNKWAAGDFTDVDKEEFQTIMDAVQSNSQQKFENATKTWAKKATRVSVPVEEAEKYFRLNTDFASPQQKARTQGDSAIPTEALIEALKKALTQRTPN